MLSNKKIKLYKFRPLGNEIDLGRAIDILNTGMFWCSKIYELNDPMEGVFIANKVFPDVFDRKNERVICSFSGPKAFKKPVMWGYYANAFKGIAIEIEVEENKVRRIEYEKKIISIDNLPNETAITKILTSKLKTWKHEDEYRFIERLEMGQHKIGTITKVYFGNPYDVDNRGQILENSQTLRCHECLKRQLLNSVPNTDIEFFDIQIADNGTVNKGKQIKK